MIINRNLSESLLEMSKKYPVVSLTGPRQSGKTTLLKHIFPEKEYVSLEDPDIRLFAQKDPKGFLSNYEKGAILDEIQRVPELFSYIQTIVDKQNVMGMFILSGSQNFLLSEYITQTLAGRIAVLKLLPLSYNELKNHQVVSSSIEEYLFKGAYPAIYDREINPIQFYSNYLQTYVERDVRQLKNISDLSLFVKFLKLCAGRIGQLLNMSSLANDCGISVNTVKSWISILEASYILFLQHPYHKNFNKRLVKMPKLYFYDTGLASSILGIENTKQLSSHYLIGGLFENYIISELIKNRFNKGLNSNTYFWRDSKGHEVDCVLEYGDKIIPIEIKSGKTISLEYFKNLKYWKNISSCSSDNAMVIYGGNKTLNTKEGTLLSWNQLNEFINNL